MVERRYEISGRWFQSRCCRPCASSRSHGHGSGKPCEPQTATPRSTGHGIVLDQTGALTSGAQVKVTSLERGLTKTVTTGPSGQWVVAGMPTGTVKIEASARGFQSAVYRKTPYDASRPSEYSIPLSVGTASETIEVATAATLIETTKEQLGTLLPGGTPEPGSNAQTNREVSDESKLT